MSQDLPAEVSFIDKSTWTRGPWDSEPDRVEWRDPASGYACLALRGPVGAWCGYVGVPEGHPAHGLHYDGGTQVAADARMAAWRTRARRAMPDAPDYDAPDWQEQASRYFSALTGGVPDRDPPGPSGEAVAAIRVHGGLTFSGPCAEGGGVGAICHTPLPGESEVHWFGFDCGHVDDVAPGLESRLRTAGITGSGLWGTPTYRDLPYVKDQVESLAAQLHTIAQEHPAHV